MRRPPAMSHRGAISASLIVHLLSLLIFPLAAAEADRAALLQFKAAVASDPAELLASWLDAADSDHCTWPGVSCDGESLRVVRLVASGFGFSGPIPERTIGKLSALRILDLSRNNITALPTDLGELGVSLRNLNLSSNKLTGELPSYIGNFNLMETLDLSHNQLSGGIPAQLVSLSSLRVLNLSGNRLTGTISNGFGSAFVNLSALDLSGNRLSGKMPDLAGLSSITYLNVSGNLFQQLSLGAFRGPLQVVDLSKNQFHGLISQINHVSISNWSSLVHLDISMNKLTGEFFPGLGRLQSLKHINLAFNKFSSQDFTVIELPSSLQYLNLSRTNLTGRIPHGISQLHRLKTLDLSQNHLSDSIPELSTEALQVLDLSLNNLTGEIPRSLQHKLARMSKFNFSYNNLTYCGEKFSPQVLNSSFIGSQSDCPIAVNPVGVGFVVKRNKHLKLGLVIAFSVLFAFAGLGCLAFSFRQRTRSWAIKQPSYKEEQSASGPFHFRTDSTTWVADIKLATSVPVVIFEKPLLNFTFADLLSATCYFDRGTLLAEGRCGPVYRGFLPGGIHVAIKVLIHTSSVTNQEAARELDRLGQIKHPNLVSLTGYCLAGDQRIAIYDYMENGNLQNLLHDLPLGVQSTDDWTSDTWEQDNASIHSITTEGMSTWRLRHKIALGAARALAFLHHGCFPQMVHRDVKASSIYLDSALEPRLAGFGLSSVVGTSNEAEMTPGYAAPELSEPGNPSTAKCDVYGFGVVLFELITGKKAIGDEYGEGKETTLVSWARELVRRSELSRLIDPKIRETALEKQIVEALRIAYLCTANAPSKRPSMQQIVGLLKDIEPAAETQH